MLHSCSVYKCAIEHMPAKLLSTSAQAPDKELIGQAATALQLGKLVAFPTETVYGLGADATNDKAVASIFAAKGRPSFNPLIVHVAEADQLAQLVDMNAHAADLAAAFMPGALTLVLPRKKDCAISWLVSAGLETLAIRMPSHPVAQALLRASGIPIAAPSANRSGTVSATTPLHVMESLGEQIDMILGAGRCPIGVESTILDLSEATPKLLRHGGVTREQIEAVIGPIMLGSDEENTQHPKAPGQLESHYAPRAELRLGAKSADMDEALLAFGPEMGVNGGKLRLNLSARGNLHEAAANLFAMLRELDQPGITAIAVMPIPATGLGAAINDRLRRAAAPRMPT